MKKSPRSCSTEAQPAKVGLGSARSRPRGEAVFGGGGRGRGVIGAGAGGAGAGVEEFEDAREFDKVERAVGGRRVGGMADLDEEREGLRCIGRKAIGGGDGERERRTGRVGRGARDGAGRSIEGRSARQGERAHGGAASAINGGRRPRVLVVRPPKSQSDVGGSEATGRETRAPPGQADQTTTAPAHTLTGHAARVYACISSRSRTHIAGPPAT
jgi:hypothetical protein